MTDRGSYCCFFCPKKDYSEKNLNDTCSQCGHSYNYPLVNAPKKIGEYQIVKSLGRGFYATTYIAKSGGRFGRQVVLKVSPVSFFDFFGKNFEEECMLHHNLSETSDFIVKIEHFFSEEIDFSGTKIPCEIQVLEYIDGIPLNEFLAKGNVKIIEIAQIAIDLHYILENLKEKGFFHNDLLPRNIIIQSLSLKDAKRRNAIAPNIRAVAIDLGSLKDESRSDSAKGRLNDTCQVASVIKQLLDNAASNPDNYSFHENRLIALLETQSSILLTPSGYQSRLESMSTFPQRLIDCYYQQKYDWKQTLVLRQFTEYYNAQLLESWFIPELLVNPGETDDAQNWISRIAEPGPTIITGMRGCGKTMFLRALEFHARAKNASVKNKTITNQINEDGYIGLYVSCTRLLDDHEDRSEPCFERLFLEYCRRALMAIKNLEDIDDSLVKPESYKEIANLLSSVLTTNLDWRKISSEEELESEMLRSVRLSRADNHSVKLNVPHVHFAFEQLASTLRNCSTAWSTSKVFFLLDDASTRYLKESVIESLLSTLLVPHQATSFKITTENQTLNLAILSPGKTEKGRTGRDYNIFDLGREVYEITGGRNRTKARDFVSNILQRRSELWSGHPHLSIKEILGDCTREDIARNIFASRNDSLAQRKIYHGISALSSICVGDIGDVIKLYDLMLKKHLASKEKNYPIKKELQSEAYQEFFSGLLFDLNRRDSKLRDWALSFASAANKLLIESGRSIEHMSRKRLRQYSKIYIQITPGDKTLFKKLRELIDSGVFVLGGGSQRPRTKANDTDPIHQFILTYRKIFGVSNYIGLADSDRFELKGEQLSAWLDNPSSCEEILLRNMVKESVDDSIIDDYEEFMPEAESAVSEQLTEKHNPSREQLLFDLNYNKSSSNFIDATEYVRRVDIKELRVQDDCNFDILVTGLGFEDRTLASTTRLLNKYTPKEVITFQYPEDGRRCEIVNLITEKRLSCVPIDHNQVNMFKVEQGKKYMVDVTGLSKPLIFNTLRQILKNNGEVYICHTLAEKHYPTNESISKILSSHGKTNFLELSDAVSKILMGEKAPYYLLPLLDECDDPTNKRVLFSFSSPKHQRLFTLLDEREYDSIILDVADDNRPRSQLANLAAEFISTNHNTQICKTSTNDIKEVYELFCKKFMEWGVYQGYSFECGLTGSKMQTVATALASVIFKFSQCWYVKPETFDVSQFTEGEGESHYYHIMVKSY